MSEMTSHGKNLLFAGVGGQGTLVASEIAARAAVYAGFDVKKSEIHGASQRGGPVVSHVRYAEKVHSPLTPAGEVDILIGMEQLEVLRWAHYVAPGGFIVVNKYEIPPAQFGETFIPYPEEVDVFLVSKGYEVAMVDANAIAREIGNPKVLNVVLLGAASHRLGIDDAVWMQVFEDHFPLKIREANIRAFVRGKAEALRIPDRADIAVTS